MNRGQSAAGRDFEYCAAPTPLASASAIEGCAVEVSIAALHQRVNRVSSVAAVALRAKAVERGHHTLESDFEDHTTGAVNALGARPSDLGRSIQVAVAALHQPGLRVSAVATVGLRAKAVKQGVRSIGGDLDDRAATLGVNAETGVLVVPAPVGCHIEIAVARVQPRGIRTSAVARRPLKTIEVGKALCRRCNGGRSAKHQGDASDLQ